MSNFKHLFGNVYRVKTQAGFNQALYHCMDHAGYPKSRIRESVQSWPTKYPATIEIEDRMFEQGRIFVHIDRQGSYPMQLTQKIAELIKRRR